MANALWAFLLHHIYIYTNDVLGYDAYINYVCCSLKLSL